MKTKFIFSIAMLIFLILVSYAKSNSTPNKLIEKFSKEVQKRELNDFASARKTSVWKVIDNTWN